MLLRDKKVSLKATERPKQWHLMNNQGVGCSLGLINKIKLIKGATIVKKSSEKEALELLETDVNALVLVEGGVVAAFYGNHWLSFDKLPFSLGRRGIRN